METSVNILYIELKEKYEKSQITREEFAAELGISTSTLDRRIRKGYILKGIKDGESKNSSIYFPLIIVAKYLEVRNETALKHRYI